MYMYINPQRTILFPQSYVTMYGDGLRCAFNEPDTILFEVFQNDYPNGME